MESLVLSVSSETISALTKLATGDEAADGKRYAPYKSGSDLVRFFNSFGASDSYGNGFPSRWQYAETKLLEHNGTTDLRRIVEAIIDPRRYLDSEINVADAVEYLNRRLNYDGFAATIRNGRACVRRAQPDDTFTTHVTSRSEILSHDLVADQLDKCDAKIQEGDYSGAITNARSLVEQILFALSVELGCGAESLDGSLPRLFKKVGGALNLDPTRNDISNALQEVLRGFTSIVNGLSAMRNRMSDAHASTYRPDKHHAVLAVNAAKTLTEFLLESFRYQKARGLISSRSGEELRSEGVIARTPTE